MRWWVAFLLLPLAGCTSPVAPPVADPTRDAFLIADEVLGAHDAYILRDVFVRDALGSDPEWVFHAVAQGNGATWNETVTVVHGRATVGTLSHAWPKAMDGPMVTLEGVVDLVAAARAAIQHPLGAASSMDHDGPVYVALRPETDPASPLPQRLDVWTGTRLTENGASPGVGFTFDPSTGELLKARPFGERWEGLGFAVSGYLGDVGEPLRIDMDGATFEGELHCGSVATCPAGEYVLHGPDGLEIALRPGDVRLEGLPAGEWALVEKRLGARNPAPNFLGGDLWVPWPPEFLGG